MPVEAPRSPETVAAKVAITPLEYTQSHGAQCLFCMQPPSSRRGSIGLWPHRDSAVKSWMIAPTRHVTILGELRPEEVIGIYALVADLQSDWLRGDSAVGVNVVWNLGASAGQSLPHLHCHILARGSSQAPGPLPGFGPRWWLKSDLKGMWLLKAVALLNRRGNSIR